MDMWAFPMDINRWGAGGALVKMEGVPSGGNSVPVYFSCEDCGIEEGRAVQFGGRVQKSKTSMGQYGFISLVYDSEGNRVGLHSVQ